MTIVNLRVSAAYVVSGFALLIGAMGVAIEYFAQGGFGLASLLSIVSMAALLVVFVVARQSQAFRYTAVSVMMAEVIALLIASRGYTWQMDMHMAFFVALALCALMYDVRAIMLGTVLVAVHHIGLGMTLESLVFYGGGSIYRVALHAGLLLTAAAGLIWLTLTTQRLLGIADEHALQAAGEAEKVRSFAAATENERAARNEAHRAMMADLKAEMGGVVEAAGSGDFTRRVKASFADAELNALAEGINRLVETVDRGLGETGSVLAALADSDLTRRVSGDHEGAFNALKTSTNAVADRMNDIMRTLRQTSGQLKSATGEMLTGSNDLSERTRKQATTIQETAAAIAQLAHTVQESARSAREASSVAGTVSRTADEGGQVMQSATQAMERINESSAKISNIIGLIDDIAFQTNLLALNASVEAARAGDAGKGFAVVAIEVRRLAQSAAKASSEVKALIEQSAGEVKVGSRFVTDAASKLGAMLEAARTSNALMDGIARESAQQASALEEVTDAVRQLDEMTQHNAALVEETNASIEQTKVQASELDAIVAVFSVEDGEHVAAAPARELPRGRREPVAQQARVRETARAYRVDGNAALDEDWSEF